MSINAHGYLVPRVCYTYLEIKVALQAVGCTGMPGNMSFELDIIHVESEHLKDASGFNAFLVLKWLISY